MAKPEIGTDAGFGYTWSKLGAGNPKYYLSSALYAVKLACKACKGSGLELRQSRRPSYGSYRPAPRRCLTCVLTYPPLVAAERVSVARALAPATEAELRQHCRKAHRDLYMQKVGVCSPRAKSPSVEFIDPNVAWLGCKTCQELTRKWVTAVSEAWGLAPRESSPHFDPETDSEATPSPLAESEQAL